MSNIKHTDGRIGYIYIAKNIINNKSYIGFTINLKVRKRCHVYSAMVSNSQTYFHRAIRKYGSNNFIWNIIDQSSDIKFALNVLERRNIELYKTHIYGYNMSIGGDGSVGIKLTLETRKKISLSKIGRPSWNKGLKGAQVAWNKGISITGTKHTQADLIKMRVNKNNKSVGQYDLHGNLIRSFQSQRDAARNIGRKREGIRDCCSGIQKTAYGYIWKHLNKKVS